MLEPLQLKRAALFEVVFQFQFSRDKSNFDYFLLNIDRKYASDGNDFQNLPD